MMRMRAGPAVSPAAEPGAGRASTLHLLGEFRLEHAGRDVDVPLGVRRLIAFVALHPRGVARGQAAATLWPDAGERRAAGNLRSALWRLRQAGVDVVTLTGAVVALDPGVRVDLHEVLAAARGCLDGVGAEGGAVHDWFDADLLPDWYDEWLVIERERLRQLRLHALEALADRSLADGATGRAIDFGLSAVAADPLRESAQRVLIEAHLADGNAGEALRRYSDFRQLLRDELGVPPSPQLDRMVAPYRRGARRPRATVVARGQSVSAR